MPKRAEDYMADRREHILDAALSCCWQKGWNQTSLRDVADAAGLSKGGLYVHFPTKTELLKGILQRNREQIERIGAVADLESLVERIVRDIAHVAGPGGRERAISQNELQLEGLRTPELKPLVEDLVRDTVQLLDALVRRLCPGLGADAAQDRALSILFLLEGLRAYAAMADGASLDQLRRIVARDLRTILTRASD